jgi:hypothetical protein
MVGVVLLVLAADPYAQAAQLGRLRAAEGPCPHDAYMGSVLDLLEKAMRKDPGARDRAIADRSFDSVHGAFRWQRLLGRTPEKDAREILIAVAWFGPSPGAFGPSAGLKFEADGKVTWWTAQPSADGVKRISKGGTWSVAGNKVSVVVNGKAYPGILHPDGSLTFPTLGRFTDDADECSA